MKFPYSETVLEHFRHPRNVGKIENADGKAIEGSPACGDMVSVYINSPTLSLNLTAALPTLPLVLSLPNWLKERRWMKPRRLPGRKLQKPWEDFRKLRHTARYLP